jgi:hypothetical protein
MDADAREQVELYIAARSIADLQIFSKSDPQAHLYQICQNGQQVLVGKTEVIWNNLNPEWSVSFILDFIFEQ